MRTYIIREKCHVHPEYHGSMPLYHKCLRCMHIKRIYEKKYEDDEYRRACAALDVMLQDKICVWLENKAA
jgi:hypothetical protein